MSHTKLILDRSLTGMVAFLFVTTLLVPFWWRSKSNTDARVPRSSLAAKWSHENKAVSHNQEQLVAQQFGATLEPLSVPKRHAVRENKPSPTKRLAVPTPITKPISKPLEPQPVTLSKVSVSPTKPKSGLDQFEISRQVATLAPPVANEFTLDQPASTESAGPALDDPASAPPVVEEDELKRAADPATAVDSVTNTDNPPRQQPQAIKPSPQRPMTWPPAVALTKQLEALAEHDRFRPLVTQISAELEKLKGIETLSDKQAQAAFQRLRALADEAGRMASTDSEKVELGRVQYSITRRLAVWEQVRRIAAGDEFQMVARVGDADSLLQRIRAVDRELNRYRHGGEWSNYLLLDQARQLFSGGDVAQTSGIQRQELARTILRRIESTKLTERQQAVFEQPVYRELRDELRRWASEPVVYRELLLDLEKFEYRRGMAESQRIADRVQNLRWSPREMDQDLAQHIEMHYRNANVRVAVSAELINRLLPPPERFAEPVNDTIAGARVLGRSETENRLFIRLFPDRGRLRLGLEAHGMVASETESHRGPVTFFDQGLSRYRARKQLLIDRRGLAHSEAEAEAESDVFTTGLETDLDFVPIVGALVRSYARQKRGEQEHIARYEAESMLAGKAQQRMDEAVQQHLAEAQHNFHTKFVEPLESLRLNPIPVSLETTDERLIARYRLAGQSQLGGFTPRPRAYSDSLLSVQVHETALNNTIEQLKLDGNSFDLRELYTKVVGTFSQSEVELPADMPENVTIKFPERDALRLAFDDGRVTVTLRINELSNGRSNHWTKIMVRVQYVPVADGFNASFARDPDGYIELIGHRLGLGDQIALRGIFSKVFAPKEVLPVIPKQMREDERLADLHVSQFVVDDGWIGLALAPKTRQRNTEPVEERTARFE